MADAKTSRILCLGSAMVDILAPVPALPHSGEGVISEENSVHLGGCALNTAYAIKLMGGDVRLFVPVGKGPFAGFIREQLAAWGMDAYQTDEGIDSGAAICMVEPDGERTMLTLPGVERHFCAEWLEDLDPQEFAYAEVCGYEVDGIGGYAIIDFLERCVRENPQIQIVFAPGPPIATIAQDKIDRFYAMHAMWHLNASEVRAITGLDDIKAAGFELSARTGNVVVVTDGGHGSYAFDAGECFYAPACSIVVKDTIGAGDSHVGALLACRAQGIDWEEALARANRMSAAVCQVTGSILSEDEARELLAD